MKYLRRTTVWRADTPETAGQRARRSGAPGRRRAGAPTSVLLTQAGSVVAEESATEDVLFAQRARSNNAPLATGRYRR